MCKHPFLKEKIEKFDNGKFHIRGSCSQCGKWIRWVPFKDSYLIEDLLRQEWKKENENPKTNHTDRPAGS